MFFKKRGDLDFFRKGGFECMGRRREDGGVVVSGIMFNYKISPASQAVFRDFLQAEIF
jgi:hypothetical protein